jgi:hypothetical protein
MNFLPLALQLGKKAVPPKSEEVPPDTTAKSTLPALGSLLWQLDPSELFSRHRMLARCTQIRAASTISARI